jgi:MFS transporter, DHA1 family, quinolone resistance protein
VSSLLFAFGSSFAVTSSCCSEPPASASASSRSGALALIGDFSRSTREHTSFMNTVEGFFGGRRDHRARVVATLLTAGLSWKYLYVIAAAICGAARDWRDARSLPRDAAGRGQGASFAQTLRKMRDAYALGFSVLVMLYVAVEVAIYVWMPTYLSTTRGPRLARRPMR